MEKIAGTWRGEYRINHGTEDEPDVECFHFQTRLSESDEVVTGKFKDLNLVTQDSEVKGFIENDFISFIRYLEPSKELLEVLNIEDDDIPIEIVFNGNWNDEEGLYQGVWEIEIESESDSFQEDIFVESRTGDWYLMKFG